MRRGRFSAPLSDPIPVDTAKFNKGQRVWCYLTGGPSQPSGQQPGVVKRVDPAGLAVLLWHSKNGFLTFNARWSWQVKAREDEVHARHQGYEIDRRYDEAAII